MKKLSYLLSSAVLALLLVSVGCDSGGGDETPAVDQVGASLNGTWEVTSVTFNGTSRNDEYTGANLMTLKFTYDATLSPKGGTVERNNGGPDGLRPFAVSETWQYVSESAVVVGGDFNITREDGVIISVQNLNETSVKLTFSLIEGEHNTSRTEAVFGTWVFELSK